MPAGWKQIKDIFQACVELDPDSRASFLAGACASDAEIRLEVESLLAAHERAGDFIENDASSISAAQNPDPQLLTGKSRLGSYELLGIIASGGMGVVYKAVRADDAYRREVAIKLIRADVGLWDPQRREDLHRRFRHERQTLADLDHPNIARLYDGGSTDDGIPYLVMEYVEGQPIDMYCDEQRLSIARRLELFRVVCSAVQFAHQHLVIHRDLKPGNILVTREGVPKLLDFGIAKLLQDDGGMAERPMTGTGLLLMTPEYASPEQVRGQPISTTTDVYSLGVILYELLCGHRPYQQRHAAGDRPEPRVSAGDPSYQMEFARLICEQDPEPPSSAVSRIEDVPAPRGTSHITLTPEIVSRPRDAQPQRLRRRLAGDLDNIVLMALRKDPQRRYVSVEQFSEDVRRHLTGLPVVARKDTLRYRATKFITRHRAGVLGATAAGIALLVGIGATIHQTRIANAHRIAAEANLARAMAAQRTALAEAQTSREVTRFLVDVFKVADPFGQDAKRENSPSAETILTRGAERIARELSDRPEIQATLMDAIGRVYLNLGVHPRAEQLLSRALELREQIFGENDAVAASLNNLGEVRRATGDYASAEALLSRALDLRRRLLGANDPSVGETLENLARVGESRGDYARAEELYRSAQEIYRTTAGESSPAFARVMSNLAAIASAQGDYQKAEQLQRQALTLLRQIHGERHLDVAAASSSLADLLQLRREYGEAETNYRLSLDIYHEILGDEHPYIAVGLNNLASVLEASGDLSAAEPLHHQALSLLRKLYGPDHPSVASSMNNLAMLLKARGDLDGAEAYFRDALELRRRVLGSDHPLTALSLNNLGLLYHARKDFAAAEPIFREALAIRRKRLGPTHPLTLKVLNNLSVALRAKGDIAEAQALRQELESAQKKTTQPHAKD